MSAESEYIYIKSSWKNKKDGESWKEGDTAYVYGKNAFATREDALAANSTAAVIIMLDSQNIKVNATDDKIYAAAAVAETSDAKKGTTTLKYSSSKSVNVVAPESGDAAVPKIEFFKDVTVTGTKADVAGGNYNGTLTEDATTKDRTKVTITSTAAGTLEAVNSSVSLHTPEQVSSFQEHDEAAEDLNVRQFANANVVFSSLETDIYGGEEKLTVTSPVDTDTKISFKETVNTSSTGKFFATADYGDVEKNKKYNTVGITEDAEAGEYSVKSVYGFSTADIDNVDFELIRSGTTKDEEEISAKAEVKADSANKNLSYTEKYTRNQTASGKANIEDVSEDGKNRNIEQYATVYAEDSKLGNITAYSGTLSENINKDELGYVGDEEDNVVLRTESRIVNSDTEDPDTASEWKDCAEELNSFGRMSFEKSQLTSNSYSSTVTKKITGDNTKTRTNTVTSKTDFTASAKPASGSVTLINTSAKNISLYNSVVIENYGEDDSSEDVSVTVGDVTAGTVTMTRSFSETLTRKEQGEKNDDGTWDYTEAGNTYKDVKNDSIKEDVSGKFSAVNTSKGVKVESISGFNTVTLSDVEVTDGVSAGKYAYKDNNTETYDFEEWDDSLKTAAKTYRFEESYTAAGTFSAADSEVGGEIKGFSTVKLTGTNKVGAITANKVEENTGYDDDDSQVTEYVQFGNYKKTVNEDRTLKTASLSDTRTEKTVYSASGKLDIAPDKKKGGVTTVTGGISGYKTVNITGVSASEMAKISGGISMGESRTHEESVKITGKSETEYETTSIEVTKVVTTSDKNTVGGKLTANYADIEGDIEGFQNVSLTNSDLKVGKISAIQVFSEKSSNTYSGDFYDETDFDYVVDQDEYMYLNQATYEKSSSATGKLTVKDSVNECAAAVENFAAVDISFGDKKSNEQKFFLANISGGASLTHKESYSYKETYSSSSGSNTTEIAAEGTEKAAGSVNLLNAALTADNNQQGSITGYLNVTAQNAKVGNVSGGNRTGLTEDKQIDVSGTSFWLFEPDDYDGMNYKYTYKYSSSDKESSGGGSSSAEINASKSESAAGKVTFTKSTGGTIGNYQTVTLDESFVGNVTGGSESESVVIKAGSSYSYKSDTFSNTYYEEKTIKKTEGGTGSFTAKNDSSADNVTGYSSVTVTGSPIGDISGGNNSYSKSGSLKYTDVNGGETYSKFSGNMTETTTYGVGSTVNITDSNTGAIIGYQTVNLVNKTMDKTAKEYLEVFTTGSIVRGSSFSFDEEDAPAYEDPRTVTVKYSPKLVNDEENGQFVNETVTITEKTATGGSLKATGYEINLTDTLGCISNYQTVTLQDSELNIGENTEKTVYINALAAVNNTDTYVYQWNDPADYHNGGGYEYDEFGWFDKEYSNTSRSSILLSGEYSESANASGTLTLTNTVFNGSSQVMIEDFANVNITFADGTESGNAINAAIIGGNLSLKGKYSEDTWGLTDINSIAAGSVKLTNVNIVKDGVDTPVEIATEDGEPYYAGEISGYQKVTLENSTVGDITGGEYKYKVTESVRGDKKTVTTTKEYIASGSVTMTGSTAGEISGYQTVTITGGSAGSIFRGVRSSYPDAGDTLMPPGKTTCKEVFYEEDEGYWMLNDEDGSSATNYSSGGTLKVTSSTLADKSSEDHTVNISGYKDVTMANTVIDASYDNDGEKGYGFVNIEGNLRKTEGTLTIKETVNKDKSVNRSEITANCISMTGYKDVKVSNTDISTYDNGEVWIETYADAGVGSLTVSNTNITAETVDFDGYKDVVLENSNVNANVEVCVSSNYDAENAVGSLKVSDVTFNGNADICFSNFQKVTLNNTRVTMVSTAYSNKNTVTISGNVNIGSIDGYASVTVNKGTAEIAILNSDEEKISVSVKKDALLFLTDNVGAGKSSTLTVEKGGELVFAGSLYADSNVSIKGNGTLAVCTEALSEFDDISVASTLQVYNIGDYYVAKEFRGTVAETSDNSIDQELAEVTVGTEYSGWLCGTVNSDDMYFEDLTDYFALDVSGYDGKELKLKYDSTTTADGELKLTIFKKDGEDLVALGESVTIDADLDYFVRAEITTESLTTGPASYEFSLAQA